MIRTASRIGVLWLLLALSAQAKPSNPHELVLIGHITATTRPTPHCGTIAFAMKVRVQVEDVVQGDYQQTSVDIIVGCPELFATPLVVGARARWVLAREQPRPKTDWAFLGELPPPRFPEFWLVKATVAKD
jgi:hypothetical protein